MSGPPAAEPVLRLSAVTRTYSSEAETVHAVDHVDLVVQANEYLCIHGTSGSGKTTLLNLIAGLDQATSGSVEVRGRDLAAISVAERVRLRREVVGMVHQDDALVEEFTASENVALPLEVRGTPTAAALEEAAVELSRVGMGDLRNRYPRALSGGQRQRVGIARALTGQRALLLADEPTGALDSANASMIFELLAAIAASGASVIVASHDPLCREYATRVVRMRDGRLVGD